MHHPDNRKTRKPHTQGGLKMLRSQLQNETEVLAANEVPGLTWRTGFFQGFSDGFSIDMEGLYIPKP